MHSVEIRNLRVRRGGRVILPDVSISVRAGAVTGLLGPSGSGKTTLMRAIVGVQIVEAGDVIVLGRPAGTPELRRRVGYVTQSPSVYGDLTVHENLRYFSRIADAPDARIEDVIKTVSLERQADQVVRTLSGGERARASLAAALVGKPELLILDEPTVGLDPLLRRDLWRLFRSLAAAGATLVVSSHVMDEAASCDELILLRDGAIVAHAPPDAIRERTGTDDMSEAFVRLIEEEDE